MTLFLLLLVALLAFANGANDNSKGVATLVGYGAARPFQALIYAAVATAIGAGISFWFSGGLLKSFSTGLFARGTGLTSAFFICVLIGAFLWVIIATFTGLPVSTTHAITGALIGAGLVMLGQSQIQWSVLNTGFVRPLLLGPVISLVSVYLLAWPVVFIVRQLAPPREVMVSTANPIPGGAGGAPPALVVESESSRTVKGISSPGNAVHWFSG